MVSIHLYPDPTPKGQPVLKSRDISCSDLIGLPNAESAHPRNYVSVGTTRYQQWYRLPSIRFVCGSEPETTAWVMVLGLCICLFDALFLRHCKLICLNEDTNGFGATPSRLL